MLIETLQRSFTELTRVMWAALQLFVIKARAALLVKQVHSHNESTRYNDNIPSL